MFNKLELGLTFDDVLLVPQHSEVLSRSDPSLMTIVGHKQLTIPIIAAPMNTVCEYEMMHLLEGMGGSSVLHRYMTPDQQIEQWNQAHAPNAFIAIEAGDPGIERLKLLLEKTNCLGFLIDTANGHTSVAIKTVEKVKDLVKQKSIYMDIMAGNVCTGAGALDLIQAGANIIRAGIGGGSACTTRCVTGHGMPQLSAIDSISDAIEQVNTPIALIADGGIRNSSDLIKSLAIGAHAVMLGGLLAGTDKSPGELIVDSGTYQTCKFFAGMASVDGRKGWIEKTKISFVPEGESFKIPYKGDTSRVIRDLVAATKTGLTYSGAANIGELQAKAEWVRITQNGLIEGHANKRMHSLK